MTGMIIEMIGGLSLFLYGMKMMSSGLEHVAGNQLKSILEKLTSNRLIGVLMGAAVTALVQSSSATTVMLVSFVNSGIMTLNQAVWIIMGANIGATFTTQLIALNVSDLAAIMAMIGVIMIVFIKNQKSNDVGTIVAGLGILFLGMGMMSGAVEPLKSMPEFGTFMATFTNPILGVLGGACVTALIQSSSATIGILQALSVTGAINMSNCIYLLLGINIGTCITAIIASLGANKNAKRTAMIHFLFNFFSMLIFATLIQVVPFVPFIESTSSIVKVQIANANTICNTVATVLLLPFGTQLVRLSQMLLPGESESQQSHFLAPINVQRMGSVSVAIDSLTKEIEYMMDLVIENLNRAMQGLLNHDMSEHDTLYQVEKQINGCRNAITDYMDTVSKLEMHQHDAEVCISLFKISTDLERLGDHAKNLLEDAEEEPLNAEALEELKELAKLMNESFRYIKQRDISVDMEAVDALENIEKSVNALTAEYRDTQIQRLKDKQCSTNNCVVYSNILIDVERVFDHIMNVLEACRDHHFTLFSKPVVKEEVHVKP